MQIRRKALDVATFLGPGTGSRCIRRQQDTPKKRMAIERGEGEIVASGVEEPKQHAATPRLRSRTVVSWFACILCPRQNNAGRPPHAPMRDGAATIYWKDARRPWRRVTRKEENKGKQQSQREQTTACAKRKSQGPREAMRDKVLFVRSAKEQDRTVVWGWWDRRGKACHKRTAPAGAGRLLLL